MQMAKQASKHVSRIVRLVTATIPFWERLQGGDFNHIRRYVGVTSPPLTIRRFRRNFGLLSEVFRYNAPVTSLVFVAFGGRTWLPLWIDEFFLTRYKSYQFVRRRSVTMSRKRITLGVLISLGACWSGRRLHYQTWVYNLERFPRTILGLPVPDTPCPPRFKSTSSR